MSYHVLARKWRPQTFADLVGQSHVVKALTYALANNQIHHAYLFTGTRGVGKTSIARIFAKSLNCETNGISAEPCGHCESCIEITAGKFVDLIEVDAASRTGVDETRELIDSVAYLPTKGRYKVYLIDEVHMFSKSSFNALLKTLEEPPEHVKFILATTDPDKLPITILSRCLQFNLKSLTQSQICQHLANICEAESIAYDESALALLAGAGDGSMRDTLSMTDQAIAYGHGALGLSAVTEILGTIQPTDIEAILFAIATNNPNQLSNALHRLDDYEVDARSFLIEIMRRLQRMAWAKEGIVDNLSPALQSTIGDIPKPLLHLWYDIAEKSLPNLAIAGEPRQAVEMALLRMLAFIPNDWVVRHRTLLDSEYADAANTITQQAPSAATEQSTPVASTSTKTNDTAEFATKVQAEPVTEHDNLAAAEAEFSGNKTPDTLTESAANAPEQPSHQENQPTGTGQNNSWHLSAQTDEGPAPSMNEINALMQRGSDLQQPISKSHSDLSDTESADNLANTVTTSEPALEPRTAEPTDRLDTPLWDDMPSNVMANNTDKNSNNPSLDACPLAPPASLEQQTSPQASATTTLLVEAEPVVITPIEQASLEQPTQAPTVDATQATPLSHDIADFDWFSTIGVLGLSEYTHHFASLGILSIDSPAERLSPLQASLALSPKHEVMITDDSLHELSEALQNHFDAPIHLAVNLTQVDEPTPAQRVKQENDMQLADLLTQFKNEPITKKLQQAFDAEVLASTVKARHPS